jgi:hypothetical protein
LNSKQEESKLGQDILFLSALIIAALLALLYLPAFFMKRAIAKVREIFYRHGAIGVENAKAVVELGLTPPSFLERLTKPRDYKPQALQYLQQTGEVLMTGDGKLYVTGKQENETLRDSRFAPMKRRLFSFRRSRSGK